MAQLTKESLAYLSDLQQNNDRDWFAENKARYECALQEFKAFVAELETGLNAIDAIEKTKVFRIYRDIRFSKDKTPYKDYFSAGFTREGKYRRGGFFFGFQPNGVRIGGGFWGPNPQDLSYIRQGIVREEAAYRELLASEDMQQYFGGVTGDAVKTAPKGYSKDHSAIAFLRQKQFIVSKTFSDAVATKTNFAEQVVEGFGKMLPYFTLMTDFLVYDENGVERP